MDRDYTRERKHIYEHILCIYLYYIFIYIFILHIFIHMTDFLLKYVSDKCKFFSRYANGFGRIRDRQIDKRIIACCAMSQLRLSAWHLYDLYRCILSMIKRMENHRSSGLRR